MNTNILTKEEMNNLVGGERTLEELIAVAWALTPDGGSSTWKNDGNGCFDGNIVHPKEYDNMNVITGGKLCEC